MQHLAIIPDGNRRWAAKNKLESVFGHRRGMEAVRSATRVCIKNGIKYLSIYTFSLENFRRSDTEKSYLFNLLKEGFTSEAPELIKQGVKIKILGDLTDFPADVRDVISRLEKDTENGSRLQLNLLFGYGSQQEIVHAIKLLALQVKEGKLDVNDITVDSVKNTLWTSGIPDPDLIVRTSKISRLSNFLLYQAAYSEFLFLDCLWPEVTEDLLQQSLEKFLTIKRNFGV